MIQPCVKLTKCKTKPWFNYHHFNSLHRFFAPPQSIFDKYMYVCIYVCMYVCSLCLFFFFLLSFCGYWLRKTENQGCLAIKNLAFSHGSMSWTNCPWESCKFIVMFDPNIESSYTYCCSCNLGECLAKFSTMFIPTVPICSD